MSFISEQLENKIGRRSLLQLSALGGASLITGGLLAGCGGSDNNNNSGSSQKNTDLNTLNFALNLEYLEAEYYLRATGLGTGPNGGLAVGQIEGKGAQGAVVGGSVVPFSSTSTGIGALAHELAIDELAHVLFLRTALGGERVARPAINFTDTFTFLGNAIGVPNFNPFADETQFLLGAFIFEDVGVTAYKGAAPSLSKTYLPPAAGILAVEAYHAGSIRTFIANAGGAAVTLSNKISDARDTFAGTEADQGVGGDQAPASNTGLSTGSSVNIVPTDPNGIAFDRTPAQVLRIVYGNATGTPGGFFPNGINTRATANSVAS